MNAQFAQALIAAELQRLRSLPYADLVKLLGCCDTKEITGDDQQRYQLEINIFWDSPREKKDIRVMVSADGLRAFPPQTGDFIMRPDGSLIRDSSA